MWAGGAIGFVICGIISVSALFIFLAVNGDDGQQVVVQNTAVVTVAVETTDAAATEEVVVIAVTDEPTLEVTTKSQGPPSPTPSKTATAEPRPSPTSTPTPSPTVSVIQRLELGRSTENRPIMVISVGTGRRHIVIIGALHGNEPGTQELVSQLAEHFEDDPDLVATNHTLHFIPGLNPDGLVANSRYTVNDVDINRNWDTPNWTSDAPQPDGTTDSGGTFPLSEPETAALHDFFQTLLDNAQSISAITIHAHTGVPGTGRVQPGYIQSGTPVAPSTTLVNALVRTGSYNYVSTCCGSYIPTGEISNWLAINGIAAADLELPSGGWPNQPVDGKTILQRLIDDISNLMGI
jgi:hypothetical protein